MTLPYDRLMLPRWSLCTVIVVTSWVAASSSDAAVAQQLEVVALQSWSTAERLDSPAGLGLAFVSRSEGTWSPRIGYTYRSDGRQHTGHACGSFEECPEETVEEDLTLHTVDAGVLTRFALMESARARVGLAALWMSVRGEIQGRQTSGRVDLGSSSGFGVAFRVGVEWEPPWSRGIPLLVEGRVEETLTGVCATESYVPFCEEQTFLSFAAGIAVP
jgi:hypothetical protein